MGTEGDDLDDLLDSALDDFRQAEEQTVSVAASTAIDHSRLPSSQGDGSAKSPQEPHATSQLSAAANHTEADSIPSGLGPGVGLPSRKTKSKKQAGKQPAATSASSSSSSSSTSTSGREEATGISTGFNHSSHGGGSRKQAGGEASGNVGGSSSGKHSDARLSAVELLAAQTKETVTGIGAGEGRKEGGNEEGEEEGIGEDMLDQEMMQKLMKQLEGMDTEDVSGVMDVVMKQLLSREVLEQPMRQLYDRYPSWLAANADSLSPDELARYTRQRAAIGRLCKLYDDRPEDYEAIFECMGEMQQCGQPPPDMISEIAPGLELGQDGLPVLPDLQEGELPKDCCIM